MKNELEVYNQAFIHHCLATSYKLGQLVKSESKALYHFEQGSKLGDKDCQLNAGYIHFKNENYKEAFRFFNEAHSQISYNAAIMLGRMYEESLEVKEDLKKAFELFNSSAIQGFKLAQNSVARFYQKGVGVKQNYQKAFYWYEQAAYKKFWKAQHNLGLCYILGQGVVQDAVKGQFWLELSKEKSECFKEIDVQDLFENSEAYNANFELIEDLFQKTFT